MTWGHIAIIQADRGDVHKAREAMGSMTSDPEMRIEPLGTIGAAQVRSGDVAEAHETVAALLNMIKELHTVQGSYIQMNALRKIAVAFVKAGSLSDAMETIATIEGLMYRSPALQDIAVAQAEIGNFSAAWTTAHQIEEKMAKIGALHEIGKAQAKAGEEDGAIARAIKLPVSYERAHALLGIAEGCLVNDKDALSAAGTR